MAKKRFEPSEAFAEADVLLRVIAGCRKDLDDAEREAQARIREITDHYAEMIAGLKGLADAADKKLLSFMKAQRAVLFDGRDIVRLERGALIHEKGDKVSIPRDALEKCEEQGFEDAIKIVKSLDRGVVKQWPDEKLFLIGATRKLEETFSYDLSKKATSAA